MLKRWDAFAGCSPAVQQWRPLILDEAKRFRNKLRNNHLPAPWIAIISHAVGLAEVAEQKLKPGHQLNADYLRKYLLGLNREFIEKPFAQQRRQLKDEERAHERRYEERQRPIPIEDLIRQILFPRPSHGHLNRKQHAAVQKREKARAEVADKFLNTAGLSAVHRAVYLTHDVRGAAASQKITPDHAYKLRERSRAKVKSLIDEIRCGKHPELALALRRNFPPRWWEKGDGLRWGGSRPRGVKRRSDQGSAQPRPVFKADDLPDWSDPRLDTEED
jgi:hypothetical protein